MSDNVVVIAGERLARHRRPMGGGEQSQHLALAVGDAQQLAVALQLAPL